jgi:hypothetical protein
MTASQNYHDKRLDQFSQFQVVSSRTILRFLLHAHASAGVYLTTTRQRPEVATMNEYFNNALVLDLQDQFFDQSTMIDTIRTWHNFSI